jgi:hypothetical protein
VHGAPDNITVKGLTLNNDGDRFATLKKSKLITVISSANKVFMAAAIEFKLLAPTTKQRSCSAPFRYGNKFPEKKMTEVISALKFS